MVNVEQVKATAGQYIDKKVVFSVIAAGAVLTGLVWGLRTVGFKKAATVVAKAK